MRIDYSGPKKSFTSPQTTQQRPRNESSGSPVTVVIITCLISLAVGFGSGWTLSQRSAKKGFKAAMEQQSLENSPRQATTPPSSQKSPIIAPQSPDSLQQPFPGGGQTPPTTSGTQATSDPQLSFYKNLPSGQQNNVLGSGINSKDDKTAKQPLQAAIPTNLTKLSQQQNANDNAKSPTPAAVEKATVHQDAGVNAFTVQVASLSLKSEAETVKNKLVGKGYNAYIAESNQGNKGTWYRVRVGRGLEQDSAKELAGKLGKGAMAIPEKD
jgi:cell division septation protein DedD